MKTRGDYQGNRVWSRAEVERGLWVSLGCDTGDGIVEVTPRKFVSFRLLRQDNIVGGVGVRRTFEGPFEFDVVLTSPTPAGPFADVCRNSRRLSIAKGGHATVKVKWDGEKVR